MRSIFKLSDKRFGWVKVSAWQYKKACLGISQGPRAGLFIVNQCVVLLVKSACAMRTCSGALVGMLCYCTKA